jgi:hypothetical protein
MNEFKLLIWIFSKYAMPFAGSRQHSFPAAILLTELLGAALRYPDLRNFLVGAYPKLGNNFRMLNLRRNCFKDFDCCQSVRPNTDR